MNNGGKLKAIKRKVALPRNFLQEFLRNNLLDRHILRQLDLLATKAFELGLPETDIENALAEIEYNEFGLSFETIVEQMYEHNIKIDSQFYDLAMETCETLKLEKQKFNFLKELLD